MPNVKCAVIYGGVNIKTQREELKANMPNVIVATPGRLKVLAQEGTINLKKCAISSWTSAISAWRSWI